MSDLVNLHITFEPQLELRIDFLKDKAITGVSEPKEGEFPVRLLRIEVFEGVSFQMGMIGEQILFEFCYEGYREACIGSQESLRQLQVVRDWKGEEGGKVSHSQDPAALERVNKTLHTVEESGESTLVKRRLSNGSHEVLDQGDLNPTRQFETAEDLHSNQPDSYATDLELNRSGIVPCEGKESTEDHGCLSVRGQDMQDPYANTERAEGNIVSETSWETDGRNAGQSGGRPVCQEILGVGGFLNVIESKDKFAEARSSHSEVKTHDSCEYKPRNTTPQEENSQSSQRTRQGKLIHTTVEEGNSTETEHSFDNIPTLLYENAGSSPDDSYEYSEASARKALREPATKANTAALRPPRRALIDSSSSSLFLDESFCEEQKFLASLTAPLPKLPFTLVEDNVKVKPKCTEPTRSPPTEAPLRPGSKTNKGQGSKVTNKQDYILDSRMRFLDQPKPPHLRNPKVSPRAPRTQKPHLGEVTDHDGHLPPLKVKGDPPTTAVNGNQPTLNKVKGFDCNPRGESNRAMTNTIGARARSSHLSMAQKLKGKP